MEFYKKGCELNNKWGCFELGESYYYVNKDIGKAKKFYKRACELGDNDSCEILKKLEKGLSPF